MILQEILVAAYDLVVNLLATDDFSSKLSYSSWFYKKLYFHLMILQEVLVPTYDSSSKFNCNLWFYKKF